MDPELTEFPGLPPDLATAALLGGETGRLFAAYDWSSHPLGPPSTWSDELRAVVAVGLTSRFPIVLCLGAEDLFLVYNDANIAPLGEKHPAALGRRGRDVWWDIWGSIEPMLAGVIETGEATWSSDLLLPIVTAGRPQERYFTFSYGPIVTAAGDVDGVFCAVTETTERVLGQRRLHILNTVGTALMEARTAQDAARAVVEACAAHDRDLPFLAVYVEDPDARVSRLSRCTPLVAGLLPPSLEDLLPPAPAEASGSGMPLVEGLGTALPSLASVFDAGSCPERALVLPVSDSAQGDGVPVGSVVIGLNPRQPLDDQYRGFCRLLADQLSAAFATAASYQRERERADLLAELDRSKTVFLTNVSHEFRTPLTLLLGPLDDALEQIPGESVQADRLRTARRNAQRLLRLVNSLLDFARAEAGQAAPARTLVDLGSLTAQIASSFTELCAQAGVELVIRCDHVIADVDVGMWETVVLNLLSNAVKFTFAGTITVRVAEVEDKAVSLSVSDTGTGIDGADIGKLFDRFYRAGNSLGRSVEGSGIGLSLVRGLVELHEGTVELTSELGVGTTVTVRLPPVTEDDRMVRGVTALPAPRSDSDNPFVAEASQWLGHDEDTPESLDGRTGPGTDVPTRGLVLIADDNADMRAHLRRILSARWDTVAFGDGAAALRGAREHRPDVIVTDVMMPALDGFAFVTAVRADPQLASIPVLMLSARAGEEAAGEGFASGVDDYLPKPFRSADLVDRVAARITAADRERVERERSEDRTRRATARAETSGRLSAATSIEDILRALLAAPGSSSRAGAAALALPDHELGQIRIHYAGAVPAELRDRYHTVALDAPIPLTDVIRSGEPMIITDTAAADARYRVLARDAESSVGAALVHPLKDAAGSVQGAVAFLWPEPRSFGPADVATFTALAATAWAAVDRVRGAERERRIATDFQDQLLDLDRRSPAAVVSALYEPAAEAMRVGGDWYLVTPLDDPARVAVSVGDVVGHGLSAATVMSKLRSATTVSALSAADPHSVLGLLQKYASTVPGAACSTVGYAVVDSRARTVSYACAGHPYPLLVPPTGAPRYLDQGRCPPLAAFTSRESCPPDLAEFPPGSLLIMYTDGLIERRGEALDDGFARLAAAAGRYRDLPVDSICAELLGALAPRGGYTDDVAVLALRPSGTTPSSFVTAIPAATTHVPDLRHRLRAWLTGLGMPEMLQHDVLLAVGEAVGNAIEHGSAPNSANTISVEAFADEEMVSTTVSDPGSWSGDSSASRREATRGRGLTLINGLSEHVQTVRSSRGTRVTMHHRRSPAPGAHATSRGATP
ncbi:SpoIIE family protein phosphatase [Streptomyces sp. NPDC058257]|uniref:SpoIIE family protein phosphatase n=1 Tax=Streptomyces sp. NPDC058257 TaxID=3346409 RepID=UPI0036E9AF76